MQIIFHAQVAEERGVFDFETVCRLLVQKFTRRHPHVFGNVKDVDTPQGVLAQWEQIKRKEKRSRRGRHASALDGIPKHLPALLHAEKLVKEARQAALLPQADARLRRKERKRSSRKAV
jgi:uncharacterized protein YabN with tetrapyrrole methylase and pyrophosphatase domain